MLQTELDFARAERDAGIQQALNHAERVEPSWGDMAADVLDSWCRDASPPTFTSYDFIDWVEARRILPMPPTNKAFGAIFTKAARDGLIRKVGYRPHPLRHASPTVLWEVV